MSTRNIFKTLLKCIFLYKLCRNIMPFTSQEWFQNLEVQNNYEITKMKAIYQLNFGLGL